MVSTEMLESLAQNTNEYSIQKSGTNIKTSLKEIEQLIGMYLKIDLNVPDDSNKDKLWKTRPWLESFRADCLLIVPEEHNSVDEMMVPFKGKFSSIKQYMHGKPHPWGFKIWARTGISGILRDFDVYQGSIDGRRAKSDLGLSADVVIKLTSTLQSDKN